MTVVEHRCDGSADQRRTVPVRGAALEALGRLAAISRDSPTADPSREGGASARVTLSDPSGRSYDATFAGDDAAAVAAQLNRIR